MLVKPRPVPFQLIVLRILNTRENLSDEERGYYISLKKGYEGELLFDSMTDKLQGDVLVFHDILLEINNNEFQIDTLLIINRVIHLCEVKYFIGDHFYSDGKFFHVSRPDQEINNPLHQLKRKVTLLRQFLRKHGYNLPIEPHLIFDHPPIHPASSTDEPTHYPSNTTEPIH
jgi:hypothetical protein